MQREREEKSHGTPSGEAHPELPIACTLTPAQLESRRQDLLSGLLRRATAQEELPDGFRWRFEPEPHLLGEIAGVIEAEHHCCRFLRFLLVVEPGDGSYLLEVTGPAGTAEFLASLLETTS